MRDRMIMRGGPPIAEPDPVSLREAAAAAAGSLRLAWEADRVGLLLLVATNTATTAAELAQLVVSRNAVDGFVDGDKQGVQARRLVLLGGLGVLAAAGKSMRGGWGSPVSTAAMRRAEGRILDVIATMELADVEDPAFQDRLQRALMGAQRQSMLFASALSLPQGVIGLAGALAAMSASDRALVPLAIGGSIPRWYLMSKIQDPEANRWSRTRELRESGMIRHLLTGTGAAHELRAFDATPFLRQRHDRMATEADEVQTAASRKNARRELIGALAGRMADAPAATRLFLRVTRKEASVADAVAGGMAARKLAGGIQKIVETANSMRRTAATTVDTRAFIMNGAPARGSGRRPPRDFSRIVVRDLCFTYPGRDAPVLDGVDLEIARGEVVALVGENGSGKTTLAKLLCSLYQPSKGTIHWVGADDVAVDVADCDPAGVRSGIAIVFQDFVKYPSLTAAENIGIGLPARMGDRDAIVDAARQAGAHAAIEALPKGYETLMSRHFGGVDISTGQWQRVALARAFLRDAPLVVLDEPTAALDPRAERDLFETVASLYRSRSAVLISHRLSSVRFADRICVLADGRISESGTHEALLAAGGDYAELFELQAHAYR